MTDQPPSAIIISDGNLPALVAAAIEAERAISGGGGAASLMPWPAGPELAAAQVTAVGSQARFHRLALAEPPRLCAADIAASPGLLDTLALLAAVEAARAVGTTRVVWPVQFHADHDSLPELLDRIGAAIDRALLVSRLTLLDNPGTTGGEVTIETPLVDLTDRQLADLVVDLDAPAYLCWWWRRQADTAAESLAAAERKAWLSALRDAGWVQSGAETQVTTQSATQSASPTNLA